MVAGYTRQSAANIQPGLRANAEDCNAEWNQLAAAFDNAGGHDHSGSVAGDGLKIPLGSAVTGVLPIANGGSGSSTNTPASFQVNPGGVLVGAVGTAPAAGSMVLNENSAVPATPPVVPSNLYIVGANATSTDIYLDCYSANVANAPSLIGRRATGTAAVPAATQTSDVLLLLGGVGYTGAGWSGALPSISMYATENWTVGANGAQIAFTTTAAGGTTQTTSLALNGNTATFSGTVTVPTGNGIYLNGATGGTPARLLSDGTSTYVSQASAGGQFIVQSSTGASNPLAVDASGNLTINGPTATKSAGTAWVNPSSRDIKQDIQPYDKGLQAVLGLRPVTYRFAETSGFSTEGTHIGLVHEETSHMPEMHRKMTLGGTPEEPGREVDGLDCSAVTWALVNAVKTLSAEVEALKAKLGAA